MGIILSAAVWGVVRMGMILDAMAQKSPTVEAGL
jgi:hypothetical protein